MVRWLLAVLYFDLISLAVLHQFRIWRIWVLIGLVWSTPNRWYFPCGSAGKESTCHAGVLGSIPGLERSPLGGKGYLLQCSGLENSMDCVVLEVADSDTTEWLSPQHSTSHVCPALFLSFSTGRSVSGCPLHALYLASYLLHLFLTPTPSSLIITVQL